MNAKEFARKHYRLDDFPEIEKVYLESAIHFAESYHQSKLAEMLSKTNIIESLIQFVAEAGGEVDLKEVRYWGYTYLESLTDSKQKDREKCGRCDRTGQLMKVELLNTGEIVEAVEQDHNSITYYKNGVAHLVPKSAVIFIKN
jgi:GAF domain-containing protein